MHEGVQHMHKHMLSVLHFERLCARWGTHASKLGSPCGPSAVLGWKEHELDATKRGCAYATRRALRPMSTSSRTGMATASS